MATQKELPYEITDDCIKLDEGHSYKIRRTLLQGGKKQGKEACPLERRVLGQSIGALSWKMYLSAKYTEYSCFFSSLVKARCFRGEVQLPLVRRRDVVCKNRCKNDEGSKGRDGKASMHGSHAEYVGIT